MQRRALFQIEDHLRTYFCRIDRPLERYLQSASVFTIEATNDNSESASAATHLRSYPGRCDRSELPSVEKAVGRCTPRV